MEYKYNRIILFCDYGVDDAAATLHILSHSEMFGAIDIVPVGGNVAVETAYRNAHTLLAASGKDLSKVRIVDTRALEQPSADIPEIHGSDGIGDFLEPAQSTATVIDYAAFASDIAANGIPHRDCVLSLGPCTIPDKLGYVPFCTVLMGGASNERPNYGDHEFNEALDVPAFKRFAGEATAVATLDTCHDPSFCFETMRTGDALTDKFIERCIQLCKARGEEKIAVYDLVAAMAVTHPQRFDVRRVKRTDGVEYNELMPTDCAD